LIWYFQELYAIPMMKESVCRFIYLFFCCLIFFFFVKIYGIFEIFNHFLYSPRLEWIYHWWMNERSWRRWQSELCFWRLWDILEILECFWWMENGWWIELKCKRNQLSYLFIYFSFYERKRSSRLFGYSGFYSSLFMFGGQFIFCCLIQCWQEHEGHPQKRCSGKKKVFFSHFYHFFFASGVRVLGIRMGMSL
jgi:hypothetical protein